MFLFQNPVMLLERSEFWFFIGFAFFFFSFFFDLFEQSCDEKNISYWFS